MVVGAGTVVVAGAVVVVRFDVRHGDLLPDRVPDVAGFQVAHSYRTANTIGGDYYDLLPTPDGRIAVVVGDASGHGIAALILGTLFSLGLGIGLMALVFYSSRHGYDEPGQRKE